jgi:hypothetical protein
MALAALIKLWMTLVLDAISTPKEKPLTFSRKIRGLFGGAGGI